MKETPRMGQTGDDVEPNGHMVLGGTLQTNESKLHAPADDGAQGEDPPL
jgi:hypothetical protein